MKTFLGVGLVALVAVFCVMLVVNFAGGHMERLRVGVIEKRHHDAYTVRSGHFVGKVWIPTQIHHPERWSLLVSVKGEAVEKDVSQEVWSSVEDGSSLDMDFFYGYFTGGP